MDGVELESKQAMTSAEYQRKRRAEYWQKWYAGYNKERKQARGRMYYAAHKDVCKARVARWRAAHPGYQKGMYAVNPQQRRKAAAIYRAANRESLRTYNTAYQKRRRARIKAAREDNP